MAETVTVHGYDIPHPGAKHISTQAGGKAYLDVEGRLKMLRSLLEKLGATSLDYEIISGEFETGVGHLVGVKSSVILHFPHPVTGEWVTRQYDGVSQSDITATQQRRNGELVPAIQAGSPSEVAQTSAIGRALGLAAIDLAGVIESSAGMTKAGALNTDAPPAQQQASGGSRQYQDDGPEPNGPGGTYVCEVCEADIPASANGKWTAKQVAFFSKRDTNQILCYQHKKEAAAALAKA